jgi:anti-sigma28 factor (negative regulator of flagellin synthesis)
MKINNPNGGAVPPSIIPPSINGVAPATSAAGSTGVSSAVRESAASDQLQLSSLSTFLSGSASHIAKLSQLNSAVSSGKYNVDASVVSAGIIRESLIGSGSGLGQS